MATTNRFSTNNHRKSEGEHHEEDSQLKLMPEWDNFQLDRYAKVIMFGEQVKADQWMTILLWWVWTYVNKEGPLTGDTIRNLRGTCNDERPQYGAAIT